MNFDSLAEYTAACQLHYEDYFGKPGRKIIWRTGPIEKLHPYFYLLEFAPTTEESVWTYCTVGMPLDGLAESPIELFLMSPQQDESLAELLLLCTSFHRNSARLDLNHTVNTGRPWLTGSCCDHAFISLPYLHGEELELFDFASVTTHCYWLIPITEAERDYKIQHGAEALEELFEQQKLDYLNPKRNCLISL